MANYIENFKSKMDWANVFVRTGNFPLDRSSIFGSYDDAVLYAAGAGNDSRGLGKTSYVGQVVTVYENGEVNVYVINESRELQSVGSGNGSLSLANVTIVNGKVQEATSENLGQIIYITEGTGEYPAGPYIVTGEGEVARLGTTTASGDLAGDVNSLKGKVSTLEGKVNGYDGSINTINGKINSLESKDNTLQGNIDAVSAAAVKGVKVDGVAVSKDAEGAVNIDLSAYAKANELPVYSIAAAETEEGFASTYRLMKNGVAVGASINIPKDKVLQSALIKVVDTENQPVEGYKVGDKYFEFTFQNQSAKMYLLATDLVDVYTAGQFVTISDSNEISLDIATVAGAVANQSALTSKFEEKGAASTAAADALSQAKAYTNTQLAGYIAKEDGKDLMTSEEREKLAGIAEGAQVNKIENISVNGVNAQINGKTAVITYVESLDGLSEDETRAITAKAVAAKFNTVNASIAKKFTLEEVDVLPESGKLYTIYMEKMMDEEGNVTGYKENLWMNNAWHQIGSSLYATKELASADNDGLMSKEHYIKLSNISTISDAELKELLGLSE